MSSSTGLGRGLGALIPQKSTAELTKEVGEHVFEVAIERIMPNPRQPREQFGAEAIEDLTASVKLHGILQPLIVVRKGDGYELIAGERRLRAAKALGMKAVPAVVRTASDQQKLELALIENLQREDLNPLEEAKAYRALVEEFGLQHEDVARRVGKSRPVISNTLRLLELPSEMQDALVQGKITYSSARALLGLSPDERRLTFQKLLRGDRLTSADIEKKLTPQRRKEDPNLRALEERLREKLGTRVSVHRRGRRGTITIEFYSDEELRGIMRHLGLND